MIMALQGCKKAYKEKPEQLKTGEISENLTLEKSVTLFYPFREGLTGEERVVSFDADSPVEVNIVKVLTLLYEENSESGRILPPGITISDVFIDGNAIVYVNLENVGKRIGKTGITAEREFISSLVLTVLRNFPGQSGVKILIDSEEKDTLGGHIDISKPFYLLSGDEGTL